MAEARVVEEAAVAGNPVLVSVVLVILVPVPLVLE